MQVQPRRGCLVCWRRKLGCEAEAPKPCPNCIKRDVACTYGSPESSTGGRCVPSRDLTEAGIPRHRVQRACLNCAKHKAKCSGDVQGCHRCAQNNLNCVYPPLKRQKRSALATSSPSVKADSRPIKPGALHTASESEGKTEYSALQTVVNSPSPQSRGRPPSSHASSGRPPTSPQLERPDDGLLYQKSFVRTHVNAYFRHIYPITKHGFLHQGTFFEELDNDSVSPLLLKAMAVVSARAVNPTPQASKLAEEWANDLDMQIMAQLGSHTVLNLQLILFSMQYHSFAAAFGKAWTLTSSAMRLALALQLNVDTQDCSFTEAETRRRMMWHIYLCDRTMAGSVDEFQLCSRRHLQHLSLPCDEQYFLFDTPVTTGNLDAIDNASAIPNVGVYTYMIEILDLWREVLVFMSVVARKPDMAMISSQVAHLQHKLDNFERKLPINMKFTSRNIYLFSGTPQRTTFLMLQSWWRECYCMLYRFCLPGFRESVEYGTHNASFMRQCRLRARQNAILQSTFWRAISSMPEPTINDPHVASLLYSNTKTLLACRAVGAGAFETTAGSDGHRDDEISTLLEFNKTYLLGLMPRWPAVGVHHREINKLIDTNSLSASSESAIYGSFPLKRQLSFRHLKQQGAGAAPEGQGGAQQGDSGYSTVGNSEFQSPVTSAPNSIHSAVADMRARVSRPEEGSSFGDPVGGIGPQDIPDDEDSRTCAVWSSALSEPQQNHLSQYEAMAHPVPQPILASQGHVDTYGMGMEHNSMWPIITAGDLTAAITFDGNSMFLADEDVQY